VTGMLTRNENVDAVPSRLNEAVGGLATALVYLRDGRVSMAQGRVRDAHAQLGRVLRTIRSDGFR
jgi:hypothetical protein